MDPNAATQARGQLFQDRSHVLKLAGIYRFPWRIHFGVIARYQDGQPFARLLIIPDLTQGPTAVRAYANGGAAFTYTGTLDIRVQKVFTAGRSEVAAVVDVYNLPNHGQGGRRIRRQRADVPHADDAAAAAHGAGGRPRDVLGRLYAASPSCATQAPADISALNG